MSCDRFTRALTDHACGADLDARTAAHLAACECCRRELEQTRRTLEAADAALSASLAMTASPGFAAAVSARVRQQEPAIAWWPARQWLGLAAAGLLIVIALATGARDAVLPDRRELPQPEAFARAHETPSVPVNAPPDGSIEAPSIEPRTAPSSRPRRSEIAHRTARRPTAAPSKTTEPEVIVPSDQRRAIARLRELLQSGALDQKRVPAVPAESSALAALVVPPLAVPDIIIPDVNRRPDTPPRGDAARDRP